MNRIQKTLTGAALVASTLTGGAIGAALINGTANAQTDGTTSTTAPATPNPPDASANNTPPPPGAPDHAGCHGPGHGNEQPLTGDDAEKAKAAALAAVPGGTVERVETDAEGDAYEAHMVTADGKHVTVKMDSSFKVLRTEEGHGPRAQGA